MSTSSITPMNDDCNFTDCPVCGHAVRSFDVRCNQCGATLVLDTTPIPHLDEPLDAARKAVGLCPRCEARLVTDGKWQKLYSRRDGWSKQEQADCPSCGSTFHIGPRIALTADETPQIGR